MGKNITLLLRLRTDTLLLVMVISVILISICMSSAFRNARADTTGTNGTTNTIPAVAIEDYATTVKEGDAKTASKLVIDNDYIDSDNNCELMYENCIHAWNKTCGRHCI